MSGLRQKLQRLAAAGKHKPAAPGGVPQVNADRLVDVVELVNWVYADQRAHIIDGRGIGLHEGEKEAEAALAGRRSGAVHVSLHARFQEIMLLGCRVDKIGADTGDLHPVAETVHDLARRLGAYRTIRTCAIRREPPIGGSIEARLGPVWKVEPRYERALCEGCGEVHALPKAGSFKVDYDTRKYPLSCPVADDHEPEYIGALRREYLAWHDDLSLLVQQLRDIRDKLGGLVVTGPRVPRQPWLKQGHYAGVAGALKTR